ncbi:MAG: ATP-binding protein [Myxococcota bacterium]
MIRPAIPANEAERLDALTSYAILDSPSERAFDGLAAIAAAVADAPIALISFVDAERQWVKAKVGVDFESVPRAESFCGHVVSDACPVVVADAAADARFHDNPYVVGEPFVRFYAGYPLRGSGGCVVGTICVVDVVPHQLSPRDTALLEALAGQVESLLELRRNERLVAERDHLRATVLEVMSEGLIVRDASGAVVDANPSALRILGYGSDQVVGAPAGVGGPMLRDDETELPALDSPMLVALRTGAPQRDKVVGVRLARGVRWISVNAQRIESPRLVVGTLRDVTEERRLAQLETAMALQKRLLTLGTLAAGVGHEINNPLSFVGSSIEFVLEELRSWPDAASPRVRALIEAAEDAREGARRIAGIVRGLRALGSPEAQPVPVDVADLIHLSVHMAMHEIRPCATVAFALEASGRALADPSALTQILVNLLVNAAQAFATNDPARNRIVVSSREVRDRVVIEVEDNGVGISADVLPRVFDPFFTTKSAGTGIGLGLSISLDLARGLGGGLTCQSDDGRTAFTLTLPVAHAVDEVEPARTRRGRVLVIDDDIAILRSFRRVLESEHDVSTVSDPRDALRVLTEQRFDVILCDVLMPHLSGIELFVEVRARDPQLAARFVFVSGGTRTLEQERFLSTLRNLRVSKPVDTGSLRQIARRLVESGGTG